MAINKITKLNLESRAIELRGEDKSFAIIAKMLSDESKEKINESSVQRFFAARDQAVVQAVEKSHKLMAAVAEAEINTVAKRQQLIKKLEGYADTAAKQGDIKTAIDALKEATSALNSLDKLLGKYETTPAVQVNLNQVNIDGEKRALLERIAAIPATDATFEDVE
jgi:polyphosphate kinase 2 (PPK2 family)